MRKSLSIFCIVTMFNAFNLPLVKAEETSDDPANSTFTTAEGRSFTYYDIDGNPLPPGTKIFLGLDARGGTIMDEDGNNTSQMGYDSRENAAYWKERGSAASGGASFGPGDGGGGGSSLPSSFSLPAIQDACSLDPKSDQCAKAQKADLALQSKTMALEKSGGKLSCSYDKGVDVISVSSGNDRLAMLSDSAVVLENPTAVKSVGDSAGSQSAKMYASSQSLAGAGLTANELTSLQNQSKLSDKCSLVDNLTADKLKDDIQLYSISCTIQNLINRLVSLFQDSDSLSQQIIEMQAAANQALAENLRRDTQIKQEKQVMKDLNTQIKTALKNLKTAKEAQVKATEGVKKAQEAQKAAAAIPCKSVSDPANPDAKPTEDCSARDVAVASAAAALASAQKALDKAVKDLEKSVKAVVDLLINKMGAETKTVLALLNGTISGDAGGEDVHFKVLGSDFTLIDLGKTISDSVGIDKKQATSFIDPKGQDKSTISYFSDMTKNYENSLYSNPVKPASTTLSTSASTQVLNDIANLSGGSDNLETIALAVTDFKNNNSEKLVNYYESMKTPQSRVEATLREVDKRNELNDKIKTMIDKNICYLDVNLKAFRDFYTITLQANPKITANPLFVYLNKFTTDKFKEKLAGGYFSKVNVVAIQKEFECMAAGGEEKSCQKATAVAASSCQWSAIVAGPVAPPANVCAVNGATVKFNDYTWTCQCSVKK